jgi:hypothetical protein
MSMKVHSSWGTHLGTKRSSSGSIVLAGFSVLFMLPTGCAANLPIVSDPPQHEHHPPEDVPWEEEYSRMRPREEIFEGDDVDAMGGAGEGNAEDDRGVEGVLADILGFPFRGIGWVLQGVF